MLNILLKINKMAKINLIKQTLTMSIFHSIAILLISFPFFGFSQSTIQQSQLIEKNEIMYFSDTPFTGKCVTLFNDGKTGIEGFYKNGKKDGEWIWYYANGIKKRSTFFRDGIKFGKSIFWYKTGIKKSEITYENDKNIKQLLWDEKGRLTKNPTFKKL
jgi:antitoxin component YwqK of YwqJK toxin-antitoxin module